ncbi:MAG: hypothetical protein IJI21_03275 [Clostridia bacterium]|nr:hypothetical protein [Clostridia bacterium]
MKNTDDRNVADIRLWEDEQRAFDQFCTKDQAVLDADQRHLLTERRLVNPYPDAEFDGLAFLMTISSLGKELRAWQKQQRQMGVEDRRRWREMEENARVSNRAAWCAAVAAAFSAVTSLLTFLHAVLC